MIELLVVIAIIAILAAILFPVFAQAKEAAKKTQSISNMKQACTAVHMYLSDNDDSYMLSNSGSVNGPGWGFGPPDTVPFQVMQPYTKNTQFAIDPMDPWQSENQRIADQCQYMGCTVATATRDQRMYALGVRSNMGYNYAFFSPWILKRVPGGTYVGSASVQASMVTRPASTLIFGTSIWDMGGVGSPKGGGNWVVETPCWMDAGGNVLPPASNYNDINGSGLRYNYGTGWVANPASWLVYGGLWPFYNQNNRSAAANAQNGRVVIGYADGHTNAVPISRVAAGCSAYGTGGAFRGTVTDRDTFMWAIDQG